MPCNSDYMAATDMEVNLAKVLALIREIETGKLPKWYGNGYVPTVYTKASKESLDIATAKLCAMCKLVDVKSHSLELQIWWRDHKKADKARKK